MNYFSGKRNSVIYSVWIVVAVATAMTIFLFGMDTKKSRSFVEIVAVPLHDAVVVVNLLPMPRVSQHFSVFTRVNTNKKVWL